MEPQASASDREPTPGVGPTPRARRFTWLWRTLAALLAVLVLALGAGFFWVRQALKGGHAEEIAERLPADVGFVVIGRGVLDHVYEFWGLFDGAEATDAVRRAELVGWSQELLGFDVTSGRAWLEAGFDPTRPWGVAGRLEAGAGLEPVELAVLLPSRDEAALEQTVLRILARRGILPEPLSGGTLHRFKAGAAAFALRDGYLIAVLAQDAAVARERLDAFGLEGGDRLVDDPAFLQALHSQADDWHQLAYAPSSTLAPLRKEGSPFDRLAPQGVVGTLRATDERLLYRLRLLSSPDAPLVQLAPGDLVEPIDSRIPGEALAALRLQLHPQKAWSNLLQGSEPARSLLTRELRENTGIDLERDVLANLDGRLTLALFPGQLSEQMPVNAVLYAGVPHPEKWTTLLDLSLPKFPGFATMNIDRSKEATWYLTDAAGVGVTRNNLVVAWGNPRELRAQVDRGDSSYLASLPGPVGARFRNDALWYGFLDPARTATFLAGHRSAQGMTEDLLVAAKSVRAIDTSVEVVDGDWVLDVIVYAPEEGFSKALRPLVATMAPQVHDAVRQLAERARRR